MALLPSLLIASLMGFIGGCLFFTILCVSAQKVLISEHPIAWFVGGWLVRMTLVVSGFYWVADGNWQLLLACLFGFTIGRWFISKFVVSRIIGLTTPTELESGVKRAS